jgi:hypothetical protein
MHVCLFVACGVFSSTPNQHRQSNNRPQSFSFGNLKPHAILVACPVPDTFFFREKANLAVGGHDEDES